MWMVLWFAPLLDYFGIFQTVHDQRFCHSSLVHGWDGRSAFLHLRKTQFHQLLSSSRSSNPVEPLTAEKLKPSPNPEKTEKRVDGGQIPEDESQRDDTDIAKELFLI